MDWLTRPHGIRIPYAVLGPGTAPRLVFAHALISPGLGAGPFFTPMLDRQWTVATLDQRNHGQASQVTDPQRLSLAEMGDDLVAVLDALDWDGAWLCGGSMGAATAMAAAARHPDRVDGLALIAPAIGRLPNESRDEFAEIAAAFRDGGTEAGIERWQRRFVQRGVDPATVDVHAEQLRSQPPAAVACLLETVMSWTAPDYLDAVALLDVPVLVLAWTGDDIHPWSLAEEIAGLASRGHLRQIGQPGDEPGPAGMALALAEELQRHVAAPA